MYIRTNLKESGIVKLSTNRMVRLKNCITRYTLQILEPTVKKENGHFVCLAKMIVKQRKIRKKKKIMWLFSMTTFSWENTNLPEDPEITLDFCPLHGKVRMVEKSL